MITHGKRMKGAVVLILLIAVLIATSNTRAVFSDRVSRQMQIRTVEFTGDGYTLERSAPTGPFAAGEDITFSLTEKNSNGVDISSAITMTAIWKSPDTASSIFNNQNKNDNAVIKVGNEAVSYTSNGDNSATFLMPKHVIDGGAEQETELSLHIPDSLKSTGEIEITFDKVVIGQYPSGISKEHSREDLNAAEKLDFKTRVGWAASASPEQNGKSLMAYLDGTPENYRINFELAFNYYTSPMRDFAADEQSAWRVYKNEVKSIALCDGISHIGNYAFAGFSGVTNINIPDTAQIIGISAFYSAGLTGEVTIPQNVEDIGNLAFGGLEKVTAFTFEQEENAAVALPDNQTIGSENNGAFYMGSPYSDTNPFATTVDTKNKDILTYSWQNDHRGYEISREETVGVSIATNLNAAVKGQKITIIPKTQTGYTYTGSVVSWTENDVKKTLTLGAGELSFIMPDSKVSITPSAAYIVEVPTPNALVYNGSEQSPVWTNYDSSTLTISGVYRAMNAGTYDATFTPKANCQWADGTTTSKTVEWTIEKATLTVPSQNGTLIYTGSAQSPSWSNYDSTKMTVGGTTSATDADTYTTTFTPKENYQWANSTTTAKAVDWTIGKATITVPSQSGTLTYTGGAQSPSWSDYDSTKMIIDGTTSGTNAGLNYVTFTPKANYQWTDGTTAAKTVSWTIGRATIATVPSQNGTLTYNSNIQSPSWLNYDSAKMTIGGITSATIVGSYNATFTPTSNYQWADGTTSEKSVPWTIEKEKQYFNVTITGKGHANLARVTIDGVQYTSATTLSVQEGTRISCSVKGNNNLGTDLSNYCKIYLNGSVVQTGNGSYSYILNKDVTIRLERYDEPAKDNPEVSIGCGFIYIIEK